MARLRLLGLLLVVTAACGNITRKSDPDGHMDAGVDAPPDAPAPAMLQLDKTTYDFGTVTEGTTGGTTMFTVKNVGAVTTGALQAATLAGANASSFGLITDTCHNNTLAPNATCTITVQFSPPFAGMQAASLNVSASPGGSVMAALSGLAVTSANLTFSPSTSTDFGSVLKTGTSTPIQFTLKNNGGTTTGTISISTTGTDAGQFVIAGTSTCGATLAPNATCTVDVKFSPTSRGNKSASLVAAGTPGGSATVGLTGLGQEQYTLTVNKTGSTGSGTVATTPNTEINCDTSNTDCSQIYTVGASAPTIALSATAATGSRFGAFSNACTGTACAVTMDMDRTVTANFIKLYDLNVAIASIGGGTGMVTSTSNPTQVTQISCDGTNTPCSVAFDTGTMVTLSASTTGMNRFTGWSGACTGNTNTCTVTMSQLQQVTANFISLQTLNVTLTGSGAGSVTATGITCGADCTENYDYGTSVTLTANPTLPDAFVGWSGGGCAANVNPCVTTVTAATTVTAKFDKVIRATWDPAFSGLGLNYSTTNLSVTRPSTTNAVRNTRSTIGKASGKWYWEVYVDQGDANINCGGLGLTEAVTGAGTPYFGFPNDGLAMSFGYGPSNNYYSSWSGATVNGSVGANSAIALGNKYMFALDMDTKKLWIGVNGTWFNGGNPSTGLNPVMTGLGGTVFPGMTFYGTNNAACGNNTNGLTGNFGASNFSFSVPSGFNAGLYGYPISWDPTWSPAGVTFANNNLTVNASAAGDKTIRTVNGKTSGKWYWEIKVDAGVATTNGGGIGFMDGTHPNNQYIGAVGNGFSFGYGGANTQWWFVWPSLSAVGTPPANTAIATNNVYMFALDLAKGQLFIGMNGTWWNTGDPATGTNPVASGFAMTAPIYPGAFLYNGSANKYTAAFWNGYAYPRPSGFSPLVD